MASSIEIEVSLSKFSNIRAKDICREYARCPFKRLSISSNSWLHYTYIKQPTIGGIEQLDRDAYRWCYCPYRCFANFSNDWNCNRVARVDLNQECDVAFEPSHRSKSDLTYAVTAVEDRTGSVGYFADFVEWISTHLAFANHFVKIDSKYSWNASVQWSCYWPQNSSIHWQKRNINRWVSFHKKIRFF